MTFFWGQYLGNIVALVMYLFLFADLAILSLTCFSLPISFTKTCTCSCNSLCSHNSLCSVAVFVWDSHMHTNLRGRQNHSGWEVLSCLSVSQMGPFDVERKRIIWFLTENVLLWSYFSAVTHSPIDLFSVMFSFCFPSSLSYFTVTHLR